MGGFSGSASTALAHHPKPRQVDWLGPLTAQMGRRFTQTAMLGVAEKSNGISLKASRLGRVALERPR